MNAYYEFSIPVFTRSLTSLRALLVKAEEFAKEKNISEEKFLDSRLAPDMYPLVKQVQVVTDNAKGAAARLAGKEAPKYEDNEKSFSKLLARCDKTLAYLATFTEKDFDGADKRQITLPWMKEGTYFEAETYLRDFLIGNFFFHFTTAYDILRNQGVVIGKMDFMGPIDMKSK
jgi:hypothetical protein